MFCYIELTLLNKTVRKVFCLGVYNRSLQIAFVMSIYNGRLQHIPSYRWLSYIAYPKSD